MFSLANKLVLISGGCSGIGLSVCQRFIAAGAKIISVDIRNSDAFEKLPAEYRFVDVSDEESVAKCFKDIKKDHGEIDVLINNAGIALQENPLEQTDMETVNKILAVNFNGVLHCMKHGLPMLKVGGRLINTASLAASASIPEYTAYAASKAAVVKITQQAALELGARRITANAVCPGTTITPMEPGDSAEAAASGFFTALGRAAQAEEIAPLFHFLASDDSAYLNGQAINIDGGWLHGAGYQLLEKVGS